MVRYFRIWVVAGLALCGVLLCFSAGAQQRVPVFEASADAEEVFMGSYFQITFTLRNAEGGDFRPPDFKDFKVVSGPSRGMSTTIINGQVSMEMSYAYVLQPRRTGRLRIGSATIEGVVDRIKRRFRSQPIEVVVLEQRADKTKEGTPDYFVRASLDVGEAYVGQQVKLDYTLFTTVEVQNFNIVEESPYLDFYAEDLSGVNPQVKREIVNGREYYSQVLKRLSLYPQKAGDLTIQPASLQLGIVTGEDASSFFFGADVKRVGVTTAPVALKVKPLPPGAPFSFSGAVGTFSFEASLDRNVATTDDALSLVIAITGDGDLKRIEAPALEGLDSFDIYEPKIKEETYGEEYGRRVGRKVFEYLLTPKTTGTFSLSPSFSYFSPETGEYVTLIGKLFRIEIREGRGDQFRSGTNPSMDSDELMEVKELSRGEQRWLKHPLFWIALLLPLLVFSTVYGSRYIRGVLVRSQKSSGPEAAREVAEKWLKEANGHLQKGESRDFYQAVSNTFQQYFSALTGLSPAEWSEARMVEELGRWGLENAQIETFRQILKDCELAIYAGMDHSDAMAETYRKAVEMLEELEYRFQGLPAGIVGGIGLDKTDL